MISHPQCSLLQEALNTLTSPLQEYGLVIPAGKIQHVPPIYYLGRGIHTLSVSPQHLQLRSGSLHTLNDFPKLLGEINWFRPYLKLST